MGNGMVLKAGSGGIDPDVLTAVAGDVLKGKTAGVNGSDEPVTGTLELTGNSGTGDVLAGKTFYAANPKTKQTGTMANQGAVNQTLNAGGSYTIPAGYHNGSGKVTASSLSSQTSGTATAAYIRSGYTAWVNGTKLTGSMTVSSILSFSVAAYSTNQMTATWKNPSKGPFSGVIIRYKTGSYPTSVTDGTQGYKGAGNNSSANGVSTVTIGGLAVGTTFYFRAWAYVTTSQGELYSGYLSATSTTIDKGSVTFTSSGTWTVPTGVRSVQVFCVGGGGGGGRGYVDDHGDDGYDTYGAGGGGGGYTATKTVAVNPGASYTVTIGAGGKAGKNIIPTDGGTTSFGGLCSASGGCVGLSYYNATNGKAGGGAGGSGGGGESYAGGSNGSKGGGTNTSGLRAGGSGQGTTTRAFGDSAGTLYAGGGGGGTSYIYSGSGGSGGAGGGGTGAARDFNARPGTANTGGGGGGGAEGGSFFNDPAPGGTGIVIIRWGY